MPLETRSSRLSHRGKRGTDATFPLTASTSTTPTTDSITTSSDINTVPGTAPQTTTAMLPVPPAKPSPGSRPLHFEWTLEDNIAAGGDAPGDRAERGAEGDDGAAPKERDDEAPRRGSEAEVATRKGAEREESREENKDGGVIGVKEGGRVSIKGGSARLSSARGSEGERVVLKKTSSRRGSNKAPGRPRSHTERSRSYPTIHPYLPTHAHQHSLLARTYFNRACGEAPF